MCNLLARPCTQGRKQRKITPKRKAMKEYKVQITDTLKKVVSVEANSQAEAISKVKEMVENLEIELIALDDSTGNLKISIARR